MEWCNNAIILYRKTYGNDNEIDIFKIKRILDFYNQPFTPEMLQEYFEGWGENTCYDVIHGGSKVASNEYKLMYCDEFVMAFETLNDFITLCTLAGVELTWKGESNG
jgi:hypothetical protein